MNRANPANTPSSAGALYIEFLHISDGIEDFRERRGESQSHLITAGCVTVKLKSPIRLVFVTLRCGQFCHSLWCYAIHIKPNCLCSSLKYRVAPPGQCRNVGEILGLDHKLIPPAPIFCWSEMKSEFAWLGPLPLKACDLFTWQGLLLRLCFDVGIQYGNIYPPNPTSALTVEACIIHDVI